MSLANRVPEYIRAITPYPPGKPITALAREMGIAARDIIKLASNENPLGMSSKAQQAVHQAISGVARYPDQFELIAQLAERHGVAMNQVVLGNGSNDILDYVARVFLGPGSSSIYSQYAFAVYPLATQGVGATSIVTPATAPDHGHDLAAMLAAIREDTRVIWIANPNNPTGSFLPADAIAAFLEQVPAHVLVVLDEAYNEYLPEALRNHDARLRLWLAQHTNLLVTRTFSKIHGLAGLRIGYALGSAEVIDLINRLRQPFNVNNLALAAASAALDDQAFLQHSFELNHAGLQQLTTGLQQLGLNFIAPHGNFVTFQVTQAQTINQRLLQRGVIVRPLANYAMPEHLRVTCGLAAENERFLHTLAQVLADA